MSVAAEQYAKAFADGMRLDPDQTVDEWADEFRMLSTSDSSEPGRWRTDRTPYLREIMLELSPSSPTEEVVFQGGAQLGKTQGGNNWVGFTIHRSPVPMLMVMPTVDIAKKVSKQRLAPMIDSTPELKERIGEVRSRDGGNTLLTKEFDGGLLMLAGANSAAGLRSMPVARLFLDEVDEYPDDVEGQGDPVELARNRTATFTRRKVFQCSTPTIKGTSRIEAALLMSDFRRYYVPCPGCKHMDWIRWENIRWERGKPETARLVCVECGMMIEERHKTAMLAAGEWRATQPGNKSAGFHLSSLYSPLGWRSWESCARDWEASSGNNSKRKAFINTVLAETWEEKNASVAAGSIMARREEYAAEVPTGVGILVAAVDTQDDRLEVVVKGYGAGEESWLIAYSQLAGDPAKQDVWLELDAFLAAPFEHESGRTMHIECTTVDTGGHKTEHVYRYAATRSRRRVFAIKGDTNRDQPLVGRPSRNNSLRVPLFMLCVDTGKEIVMGRMLIPSPSPGYMHLPKWADEEYCAQLTAEKALRKYVPGKPSQRVWVSKRTRNEAFDLEVYALAALYMCGDRLLKALPERAKWWATKPDDAPAPEPAEVDTLASDTPSKPRVQPVRRGGWVNSWKR